MLNHEILEELIYERLIEKEKLLENDLCNEEDFCFFCNKKVEKNEECSLNTLAGKVTICGECLKKKIIEEKIKTNSKVWK